MAEKPRIGLDNLVFQGRLRRQPNLTQLSAGRRSYLVSDFTVPAKPPKPAQTVRQALREINQDLPPRPTDVTMEPRDVTARRSKPQLAVLGLAAIVFIVGVTVSLQTVRTNHDASAQVAALSKKSSSGQTDVPETSKPNDTAISQYMVAADLPRYLQIPKLGVNARVMQVGVDSSGALGTPNNVYDTAWYTGSAKPGQPGATLIDGHVSSWTTHGVFYGLNKLKAGDQLQIEKGDGSILNYKVVKTQTYQANNVDMQAAITPITAGKSGLNLISCTGHVIKGTSQFDQRVIVFAEQE